MAPVLFDQPFSWEALKGFIGEASVAGYGAGPYRMPVEVSGYLSDGDPVPDAPDWVALHAPGHTLDSTCYWRESTRTLLSGDAVLSVGLQGWFNPEYVDAEAASATEDRLRKLDIELLLPGHGRPCAGHDVLGQAIGHLERARGDHWLLRRFLRSHQG